MDVDDDIPMLVDVEGKDVDIEEADVKPITKVPITIVTGYLGAGKTTLMNYILNEQTWKEDSCDIECEQVEEWLDVGNGCICCSVKDSGVNAIETLMDRRGAFDYILLETTGLADPGPHLTTAHLQISHADVLILNKSDLVTPEELEIVKDRITAINGLAKLHITEFGATLKLEGVLLDLHAYDRVDLDLEDVKAKGHSHLDPTITTLTLTTPSSSIFNPSLRRLAPFSPLGFHYSLLIILLLPH
ncbi:hypothetical protein DID88_005881 [Monilinia fructigena]|uniref:CobW/HypB/UreG nucleotide-binding domain-containing protein n=1 Tax=Monilinia fructigena TaxID=38457 RepID=A0A395J6B5_9HELO|nr:hypothetical protein DID88_005881 [Monilinia fructigena]